MFFLAVNIIKKNCVIGKQGFSLFPFFVLGIVPIFANDNYTLTAELYQKSDLLPVDREITVEQALMIARNQGYKIKSATA